MMLPIGEMGSAARWVLGTSPRMTSVGRLRLLDPRSVCGDRVSTISVSNGVSPSGSDTIVIRGSQLRHAGISFVVHNVCRRKMTPAVECALVRVPRR